MIAYLLKHWVPFALGCIVAITLVDLLKGERISWPFIMLFCLGSLIMYIILWQFKKGEEDSKFSG
ncbi:hypothetical protein [Guptibacillus algicola]|uniref:hypothetical protein n=1 Tax=Guptibacillus algicola TaxID=225844 RepID=UPI001CD65A1F|nr:hypothetical protein [Alkalihalobacillus algicola]MCA0987554.1 hypothetical protein [Alkalihalobacillus algicola]